MNRIAESELIINSRGAIYHIDLLPEELANTIITVGDPGRVAEVSKYFDKKSKPHIHFHIKNSCGHIIWNGILSFGIHIANPSIGNRILIVEKVENF